jgi:hypothetical protein
MKNAGAIPPLDHTSSWRGDGLIKLRDNFTLYIKVIIVDKNNKIGIKDIYNSSKSSRGHDQKTAEGCYL